MEVRHDGRESVVVYDGYRRIGAASVDFVRWLHEHAPKQQLNEAQRELVRWFKDHGEAVQENVRMR